MTPPKRLGSPVSVASNSLSLSPQSLGVTFRPSSLAFKKAPTLEALNRLARDINRAFLSSPWHSGDVALAIQKIKMAEYYDAHPKKDKDAEDERLRAAQMFAGEYLQAHSDLDEIDHGYRKNCMVVCRFYPSSQRHDDLTFAHHVAAMMGDGATPDIAKAWLVQAKKEGWSASELRRQVNLSLADPRTPEQRPLGNDYKVIDEADQFAIRHQNEELSKEMAALFLTRWQALVSFIERLKAAAV